jgi:predicted SnoaL-like aldol condensation-catalyzing enzyme
MISNIWSNEEHLSKFFTKFMKEYKEKVEQYNIKLNKLSEEDQLVSIHYRQHTIDNTHNTKNLLGLSDEEIKKITK